MEGQNKQEGGVVHDSKPYSIGEIYAIVGPPHMYCNLYYLYRAKQKQGRAIARRAIVCATLLVDHVVYYPCCVTLHSAAYLSYSTCAIVYLV